VSGAASSSGPLLVATKLYVPDLRPGLVPRRELVAGLVDGRSRKLVLVCAPAGWGKTVLLSEWAAAEARPFAWVSLDRGDADPVRFWSYVIAAVRGVEPGVGEAAQAALPAAGPDLIDAVVSPLINDLAALSRQLVIVLDDYHLVHAEAVHASVGFLLRYLPRSVQLVIATRADPPLPLAGLRAAGEIGEIRAARLCFSDSEADALLNGSLGLALDPADVELLRERTEGWAAGLQLAALSLQAHQDQHAFVAAFSGDERHIGEYLHEILAEQPEALCEFLLRTSILERLCAPVCDALTGVGDAAARLDQIERSNLFLIPLDPRREWYRYHHLFRDLLRHELARVSPELIAELHRRAYRWHVRAGMVDDAIAHATKAGDVAEAGELIAQHWRPLLNVGQGETVARWIDELPSGAALADARLCLARGWVALLLGQFDAAEGWRRAAERAPLAGPLYDDIPSVAANAALLHAVRVFWAGDVDTGVEAARRSVSLHSDETKPGFGIAAITLGGGLYYAGRSGEARSILEQGIPALPADGWLPPLVDGLGYLAMAYADLGEIARAERAATEAEDLVAKLELGEAPWVASSRLARGRLDEQRGDVDAAETVFSRAVVLARRGARNPELAHGLLLLARLKRRKRDHLAARTLTRDARAVLHSCPNPGMLSELLAKTERALQLAPAPASAPALPLDLDLSERELVVLRLLASELSQREIGSQLFISLNTVKGHVRSIFGKLGVTARADAVARGRGLGLI
jgi:LuxR family transcriptional regulator, maltose regulon positive regulatory protein